MRRRRNEELNHKLIPSPESSEVDEQEEEDMLMNKLSPATETTHRTRNNLSRKDHYLEVD